MASTLIYIAVPLADDEGELSDSVIPWQNPYSVFLCWSWVRDNLELQGSRKLNEGELCQLEGCYPYVNPEEGILKSFQGPKLSGFCFSILSGMWISFSCSWDNCFNISLAWRKEREGCVHKVRAHIADISGQLKFTYAPVVAREPGNQAYLTGQLLHCWNWSSNGKGSGEWI